MDVQKAINLELLQEQLDAAGNLTPRKLGLSGSNLHTYDADGHFADLPPAAIPIVNAHDATGLTAQQTTERQRTQRIRDFVLQSDADWAALSAGGKFDTLRLTLRAVILRLVRDAQT